MPSWLVQLLVLACARVARFARWCSYCSDAGVRDVPWRNSGLWEVPADAFAESNLLVLTWSARTPSEALILDLLHGHSWDFGRELTAVMFCADLCFV